MTTLIGGEMLLWSDTAPAVLLPSLLSRTPGRTLVAGPHEPSSLPAGVTVLVRGVPDAQALAAARPDVTVLCGSLEKLATLPAYDTVVALDGLDRLLSAEADPRSWDETLSLLLAVLAPGGRLLLGMENLFGVHRLTALPKSPADSEWVVPDDHDPQRPAGHAALLARLTGAGLHIARDYAAYPSLTAPTVLLGAEIRTDPALAGVVEAAVASALRPPCDVLVDPVRLATGAVRNGLTAALAPAWIVIAGHDAADTPDAVLDSKPVLLPATDLPRGRTLQSLLLATAQRRDLPTMRELLTAWQTGPTAGVPADRVVVSEPSLDLVALAPAAEALTALRAFAAAAIAGGYAHLWPIPADEAELTAVLAGMTGRELEPGDVPPADRPTSHAVGDLLAERDRLTRELAQAKAKHDWYEHMLGYREAELKRVRQMNALLSATVPGKAATSLVGGLRAGKRAMRSVVRRTRGN
ncbi:hypothetical protein [Actinoplanes solisilvae]|uniref:hypothetical protein n=1 Tax=Actinoplanes solisilvae TaxID=2486853 RepID=UPI0013E33D46|nr:hypothetical protein [Actinoplanes solisilvae]